MRRRDFAIGLLLAATMQRARAQEQAKQHRIAFVALGPVARIDDPGNPLFGAFFDELRQLGDVKGQNLTVDRYSGEERSKGFADLAREVVDSNPDVIVALGNAIALAARAANGTIPIVWIGADPIEAGLGASLARPGGNITGVTVYPGAEIWGKRLQILKEAVPWMSKVAYLDIRSQLSAAGQEERRKASRRLQISLIDMLLEGSTPSEVQRVFAEITQQRVDAVMVSGTGDLMAYRQLIVELAEKSRLPAIYGWRQYVEAGGLMAYAPDPVELGRRLANDVHQILDGAKPGDIPIYQPTKFEFLINLKTAKALSLNIPPRLLATADEVIE
jgi:putative ABC transport system substrate-binding protein